MVSAATKRSLATANSGIKLTQSRIVAGKLSNRAASESVSSDHMWLNTPPGRRAFVSLAFEHFLTRLPTESDLAVCESFLTNHPQNFRPG